MGVRLEVKGFCNTRARKKKGMELSSPWTSREGRSYNYCSGVSRALATVYLTFRKPSQLYFKGPLYPKIEPQLSRLFSGK